MNDKHKQRVLFDAVTGIDEDLIEEAAAPRMLAFPRRILRVASIAAILALLLTWLLWPGEIKTDENGNIISAPGLLVVRAYAMDEDDNTQIKEVILEEGVKFTPYVQYTPTNYIEHFPFSFSVDKSLYSGMEITLEVNTNAGIFYKEEPWDPSRLEMSYAEQILTSHYGQQFTVDIDTELYWEPHGFDYKYMQNQFFLGNYDITKTMKPFWFTQNPSFIDIIIRADDIIIGYCVIEIREIYGVTGQLAQDFSFEVLKIVSFPKVDGNWQNVTLKYVQKQINDIHAEREG